MREAMRIHFEIMEGLNEGQREKMEEIKQLMISVADGVLGYHEKAGRVYGITEDAEEEIYTDGYKGVNNFAVDVVSAGPAWDGWQAL